MKKVEYCEHCNSEHIDYVCDLCNVNLLEICQGIPYELQCSYGSNLDGNIYHFCSLKHLQEFINAQIEKEKI